MGEVPDWFNLKNYEKVLTAREWGYAIYVRSRLCDCDKDKIFRTRASNINDFNEIVKNPFEYSPKITQHIEKLFGKRISSSTGSTSSPIRIYKIEELKKGLIESFDCDRARNNKHAPALLKLLIDAIDQQENIQISLSFTDDEIVKAIKKYLKSKRAELKKSNKLPNHPKYDLEDWHQFKLLALFDLLYWREITGKKMTHLQICHILWPNDQIEIEQRLRKKGLPLIKSVFRSSVYNQLLRMP